jgi:striatin 1/3/4
MRSGKVIKCLVGHTDSVTDITILPMNLDQIASVSHDGSLRTWDMRKF